MKVLNEEEKAIYESINIDFKKVNTSPVKIPEGWLKELYIERTL